MKIILSEKEVQYIKKVAQVIGENANFKNNNIQTIGTDEHGNTVISVAENYIIDMLDVTATFLPLYKGICIHISSSIDVCRTLIEKLEAKWDDKKEERQEVE